jgi:hypothetical protein
MKLSEAIRKGSENTVRMQGSLTWRDPEGRLYACALGAAHIGNGGDPDLEDGEIYTILWNTWPELQALITDEKVRRNLGNAIWNKNDRQNWARERIANWLEEKGF